MPLLEVKEIKVSYGNIQALKGVSLYVDQGEIATIIGANGAGKSTLLKTISGILIPVTGTVLFGGERIDGQYPHRIVCSGLSHIPEGRQILAKLSVRENLELGAISRPDQRGAREDLERVLGIFLPLRNRLNLLGATLSGGEQQMLAIGRGLMANPKLLMMDEPSLGLAPMMVIEIFRIIKELKTRGKTILLVEQNAKKALQISDRGYVLENGLIQLEGGSFDLLLDQRVKDAYLGGKRGRMKGLQLLGKGGHL
jgi:branched-chain amino acid transport system ATP-binding protein